MAEIRTSNRVLSSALVAILCWGPPLAAQQRSDASEAARHFDRGYLLAQQGNLEAAIAEFKHAHALSPHPSVLYNLGQAYAASGRAVEAVQTLRTYLEQAGAALDAERRAQAAAIVDYQSQRIGTLELEIEPAGAELMIDGELLGKAPLSGPVQLTAGPHGLTVSHAGYTPRSSRVEIVGKTASSAQIRLETSGALTRLTVTCAVPDVVVSGDGVTSTRLERGGQLMVAERPAELRFERAGFVPVTRPVPADPARAIDCGIGNLDPRAPLLPVAIEAPAAIRVNVDGQRFREGKLPIGRHFFALSGDGIEPSEQLIQIGPQPRKLLVDARTPAAALAAERGSRRKLQLTLALITSAAGVVSLGAAGALYAVNQSAYSEWRDDGRALALRMSSPSNDVTAGDWDRLLERENALRNRDAAALGLTVFGGLLVSGGAVLWLTAPAAATSSVTLRIGKSSWVGYTTPF